MPQHLTHSLIRGPHLTHPWSPSMAGSESERFSKLRMRGADLAIPGVISVHLMREGVCIGAPMEAVPVAQ